MFINQVDYPKLKPLGSVTGFLFFPLLCYIAFQSEVIFYPHEVLHTLVCLYYIFALVMTRRKLRTFYKKAGQFSRFLRLFKLLLIIFVFCIVDALYLMIPFNIIMKTYASYNETITYQCLAEPVKKETIRNNNRLTDYYYIEYCFKREWYYINISRYHASELLQTNSIPNYYVAFYAKKGLFGCYYKDGDPKLIMKE